MAADTMQLWCTGPCKISVAVVDGGSAGSFLDLGYAERAPTATIYNSYSPIMNDLGGPIEAFDKSDHRKHAIVRADMTRWNETTAGKVSSVVNAVRGKEGVNDVGTIVLQEGFYLKVKLDFPYSNLPAFSGRPKGYIFEACTADEEAQDPLGTIAGKRGYIFTCIQKWNGAGFDFYTEL